MEEEEKKLELKIHNFSNENPLVIANTSHNYITIHYIQSLLINDSDIVFLKRIFQNGSSDEVEIKLKNSSNYSYKFDELMIPLNNKNNKRVEIKLESKKNLEYYSIIYSFS